MNHRGVLFTGAPTPPPAPAVFAFRDPDDGDIMSMKSFWYPMPRSEAVVSRGSNRDSLLMQCSLASHRNGGMSWDWDEANGGGISVLTEVRINSERVGR